MVHNIEQFLSNLLTIAHIMVQCWFKELLKITFKFGIAKIDLYKNKTSYNFQQLRNVKAANVLIMESFQ